MNLSSLTAQVLSNIIRERLKVSIAVRKAITICCTETFREQDLGSPAAKGFDNVQHLPRHESPAYRRALASSMSLSANCCHEYFAWAQLEISQGCLVAAAASAIAA